MTFTSLGITNRR